MIYGATGFTGRLVVEEARRLGLRPVLAGRSAARVVALAEAMGLEALVLPLGEHDRLVDALQDVAVVLHCAGPFFETAMPMFEACLRSHTHYVDITGEIAVFEALAAENDRARRAGIMVLPGAGFDVVPSDLLIAELAARCPEARVLRLALHAECPMSRGTAKTGLASIGNLRIRRNGSIVRVAAGSLRHRFRFEGGLEPALVSVLGDVSTAYWSTGIPNVETYTKASPAFRVVSRVSRHLGRMLATGVMQRLGTRLIDLLPPGPDAAQRQASRATFVAEMENASGERHAARTCVADPYGFTARASVRIARHVLEGRYAVGFQTPSTAYGRELLSQFGDVEIDHLQK